MRILLWAVFLGGLAAGVWWALPARAPATAATTVTWELAELRELGELRLLATEIGSYQLVTTIDPNRWLKAVIPVRVVLGIDLAKATVRREGAAAVVTLPTIRFLHRSSDPRRWNIWDTHGALQVPGESVSMAQLAELMAFQEAERECVALGLVAKARGRAEAVVADWLRGFGVGDVRFTP